MNFLTEIFGENNVGKSYQAHSNFPEPVTLDTAFTDMGFRELNVETDEDGRGETWPTVLQVYDWDEEEADEHYYYVDSFDQFHSFYESGLLDEFETIVIDNSRDMRVLAAKAWCDQNSKDWPQRAEWGEINDMMDEVFGTFNQTHHVVVVSQMGDVYEDGESTGEREWDGPKSMDYHADWRVELQVEDGDREAIIHKNRWLDPAGDEWVDEIGGEADFDVLASISGIPDERW